MSRPILVWFRQDLRLSDNPALLAAAGEGRPVLPVYVLDEAGAGDWPPGSAARWWLHHSLAALAQMLAVRGLPLILRRGAAGPVLAALAAETAAAGVYWNRCYEPAARARDVAIKAKLLADGLAARSFNAGLLAEPWTLATAAGRPFQVFAAFHRALRETAPPPPLPAPDRMVVPERVPAGDCLAGWRLLPRAPDWAAEFADHWTPGEEGARARLAAFLAGTAPAYGRERDRPDRESTSRLSPHLHWGEIGPRQVWHAALAAAGNGAGNGSGGGTEAFLRELAWREFSAHQLHHCPGLPETPLRPAFADFPWAPDAGLLRAWQGGRTGYPIVDAGMRQLWRTGWMHNRVRMIAASFLVKDLLQPWQSGQRWFWDTLVDADLASNAANWQWVAGCGADAAPYFRVFNPVLQGRKFDPSGAYVRTWVPELAGLGAEWIHSPWTAPAEALAVAGVTLGRSYPVPLVDHGVARRRALEAFAQVKGRNA